MYNIDILTKNLDKDKVFINEDMSKHTTFKTGGKADIFINVDNIEELRYILKFAKDNSLPLFILGNGSNILVSDKGIRGIVCKININKFEIKEEDNYVFVTLGSGNKNGAISHKLLNLEIEGFEFASRNTSEALVVQLK